MKRLFLLPAVAAVLTLAGCTTSVHDLRLSEFPDEAYLPDEVWREAGIERAADEMRRAEESKDRSLSEQLVTSFADAVHDTLTGKRSGASKGQVYSDITTWFLPEYITNDTLMVYDQDGQAVVREDMAVGGGLLNCYSLPFVASLSEKGYAYGTSFPVAFSRSYWTPFWTWSDTDGDVEILSRRVKAYGIPLIYSYSGLEYSADKYQRTHSTLWGLGPEYLETKKVHRAIYGDVAVKKFTPLSLGGGFLGSLLWANIKSENEYGTSYQAGPFNGTFGFYYGSAAKGDREERDFVLLSGILWYSSREKSEDKVVDDTNGPLWGIIGWGQDEERYNLRLLWFPIPLWKK